MVSRIIWGNSPPITLSDGDELRIDNNLLTYGNGIVNSGRRTISLIKSLRDSGLALDYNNKEEEIQMADAGSRYSIIENLAKDKLLAEMAIKNEKNRISGLEAKLRNWKQDIARSQQQLENELEDAKAVAVVETEFNNKKIVQLDAAIAQIQKISETVEKGNKE